MKLFTQGWYDRVEALLAIAKRPKVDLSKGAVTFMLDTSTTPSANPTFETPAVTLPAGATRWLVTCNASFVIDGPSAPGDRFSFFLFRDTNATPIGPSGPPLSLSQLPGATGQTRTSASLTTIDKGPIAAGSHTYGIYAQDDDSGSALYLVAQGTSITLVPLP
jgi:hypothetical protein